jgi:hypothetical protein
METIFEGLAEIAVEVDGAHLRVAEINEYYVEFTLVGPEHPCLTIVDHRRRTHRAVLTAIRTGDYHWQSSTFKTPHIVEVINRPARARVGLWRMLGEVMVSLMTPDGQDPTHELRIPADGKLVGVVDAAVTGNVASEEE